MGAGRCFLLAVITFGSNQRFGHRFTRFALVFIKRHDVAPGVFFFLDHYSSSWTIVVSHPSEDFQTDEFAAAHA